MNPDRVASIAERRALVAGGEPAWNSLRRFCIYRRPNQWLCIDWLNPAAAFTVPSTAVAVPTAETGTLPHALLARFIPPVIATAPIAIRARPRHAGDDHFWQYPCATERQAYENHLGIALGTNVDTAARVIHVYLGLPWATYIDRAHFPEEVVTWLRPRIRGCRRLAAEQGFGLAVHTVCQQIYWRRLAGTFRDLGVTDLHLSHCEREMGEEDGAGHLRLHSWPLIAVNAEDSTRGPGLVRAKPAARRRYLASFIGAHLPHYRSDCRLRLLHAARDDGTDDVLVEVGDEWHFEKTVYHEQVAGHSIAEQDRVAHVAATRRYNEVLSDSVFSLCPEGAGPNTLRIWESLAVGAIPVILAGNWRPPDLLRRDPGPGACCLFIDYGAIDTLFTALREIGPQQIAAMSAACLEVYAEARSLRTFVPIASSSLRGQSEVIRW